MNRFFCTVCGKMKRVQHYPSNVANVDSDTPSLRRGQCVRHSRTRSISQVIAVNREWKPANDAQVVVRRGKKGGK